MANDAREPYPAHVRRPEVIRPAERRRDFPDRVAQHHLQSKERPTWHLIAYAVFVLALLIIGAISYTTYAFSKYRGEILPGVYVDRVPLGGLSQSDATNLIYNTQTSFGTVPVRLVFPPFHWDPRPDDIGLQYDVPDTVKAAMRVGRTGSFFAQLLDRLPVHPTHRVALRYSIDDRRLTLYIKVNVAPHLVRGLVNARLKVANDHVVMVPSVTGHRLNLPATLASVHGALGALSKQTRPVQVQIIQPQIPDSYALRIRDRVEAFLSHPPVIRIGKQIVPLARSDLTPMLSFHDQVGPHSAAIVMDVNPAVVQSYVASLAQRFDRQPANARLRFFGGMVTVVQPQRLGRSLDQAAAEARLLKIVSALKLNAHPRLQFTVTQPPIDQSNPASYGISTLLGQGVTGWAGASNARTAEVSAIAQKLDNVLLPPGQGISFNQLVGAGWPLGDYSDTEVERNGQLVPGKKGAMQQVATTFLRALWVSGLQLVERHAHVFRIAWYEPPIGLDAVVTPNAYDLRFNNNTGKYLLLQTRVEPIRQELYIYVYGPRLRWKVRIDAGTVVKTIPHPPALVTQDPSLAPTETRQVAWPHDGADTVIQRTITYPNGDVKVDQIKTHYRPWRAEMLVGSAVTVPTPTGRRGTPTPGPTPTPTFNH